MVNFKHIGWWLYRVITPWVRSCNGLIFRILKTDGMTITHMTYVIWPWHIWNIPVIYSRRWNIPISIWNTPYTVYIIQLYYVILYIIWYIIYIYTHTHTYIRLVPGGQTHWAKPLQAIQTRWDACNGWRLSLNPLICGEKDPSDPRFFWRN